MGVLDLVFKFRTPAQTLIRAEWTIIEGSDKRGTPLLGTSVFRSLEVVWHAASEEGQGGELTYVTHHGARGSLPLLYETSSSLPTALLPPLSNPTPVEGASRMPINE